MRRITLAGVVGLALLLTAGSLALVLTSDHVDEPGFASATLLIAAWSFVVGGLVAWERRPDNRFGLLMTAVGLATFLSALGASNDSLPFTLGIVYGDVFIAVFVHALLAFPRGYLETRLVYAVVAAGYLLLTVGTTLGALFERVPESCERCPPNAFLVVESSAAATAIDWLFVAVAIPALLASLSVFRRRWRAASRPLRMVLAPVYVAAGTSLVLLALGVGASTFSERTARVFFWIVTFTFAAVPLAFLLGLLKGRLARGDVSRLLVDLGRPHAPGELRDAIARALGDPNLRLGYWIPETESFADIEGRPIELPEPGGEEQATMVERDGRPVAALIHHRSLEEDPLVVEAAAAAASIALESERRLAALADAQARNRALLDALPDLMFRMDREGTYLEVKGAREDLAAPPEELVGARAHDVLPEDVADTVVAGVRKALETGEIVTGDYRLEIGGVPRDFEARIVKAGNEAVLIVREFTAQKRAQEELEHLHAELQQRHRELEQERDFIRTVVDSTPSLLCLITPGGYVLRFNHSLERLSGLMDGDRLRGEPFWELFIAEEDREEVRRELDRVAQEGGSGEFENAWRSADGEPRRVAWSTTPLRDDRGAPRILVCGVDITERVRHEDELRRSRARIVSASDVERRRLERNLHDGAQQRLVSLSLMLRLAQARVADHVPEAERLLGQAADELAQALEELRELARGIHPAVLSDRGLAAALEALAARSPLPVEIELEDDRLPEPIEAAAYYVVAESLANVVKYAEASSVAVSIARVNGRAVVEIADDGVGGADPSKGSGLRGLVDRVEALDGLLFVDSVPGAGTRVRAEIPCE